MVENSDALASETQPLLPTEHVLPGARHLLGPLEISKPTRYGILAGIWIGTFLSALNQTLVPTMLPSISSDFNKAHQASWLGTSYLLATCTFTPLYGRLCNAMGRKGANQTALIFAGLGVLLCGLSRSMEMLILARFEGEGYLLPLHTSILPTATSRHSTIINLDSIIVSDMYSMRSRGLTQGIASIFSGLGLGLGGPFGGVITDWLGWRWAFLLQMPIFCLSYLLTSWNLNYVTEGTGKSSKEIFKRVDYLGSGCLLLSVGATLVFLSVRYNEGLPWSHPAVVASLVVAILFSFVFLWVEFHVSVEPVLAPFLLKQKIPVLTGISNFLVATCNFAIMYFYPMWFQTVNLTSASTAGLHVLPNSLSMSFGSVFAGWMIHKTGTYKRINLIFGIFPFIGAVGIYLLREDSGWLQSWFSIVPFGFGNAVVLQTMLIALLAHIPNDCMAVGTGFGQLFRGVGQVGGVAVSSALFQSQLQRELEKRIHGQDATQLIERIRHSSRLISSLPDDLRRSAQDSYAASLKSVFLFAAVSTFLAYIVRLPIPDKNLEHSPKRDRLEQDSRSSSLTEPPEGSSIHRR